MTSGAAAPAPQRRAAVAFILVTVMLDVLSLGIVIPVQPKLVEMFLDGDTAHAATIFGLMSASWALMQFVFAPILGAASDRFGRRPVVLFSNLGLGLDFMVMALAPSLGWLFVGRVISGICAASFSTATAYIADITPSEKRAEAFGLIGAAFGIGFVAGPAVGGLLGGFNPRLPFWVAAGFSLANAAYGYFVLPESLALDNRRAFSLASANPLGSLHLLTADRVLFGLSVSNFLQYLAQSVLPSVTVLYTGYRYGWGVREIGFLLAAVGVGAAVVQGALIRPIIARLGARTTLIVGYLCGAAGMLVFGLAPTATIFFLGIPLQALGGVSGPSVQQLMTARVGIAKQGSLQGATASLNAIGNLIGPILVTQIFAASIAGGAAWSGSAFVLAGGLIALAAACATATFRLSPALPAEGSGSATS